MWRRESWAWFSDLVDYLLVTDTAIGRAFRPTLTAPTEAADV